ncbi:MAG: lactate 2-monooxygenase [Rhodomicrobium sp.]
MTETPSSIIRTSVPGPGVARNVEIYLAGAVLQKKPQVPVRFKELEAAAKAAMAPEAFDYVAGGAGEEGTVAENCRAFERWRIVPRHLRGAAQRDLSLPLFGEKLASPFLLAPVGVLELAHPEADAAVAQGAKAEAVPMIISNQASVPMEKIAEALQGQAFWFQLYWSLSNDLTASLVARAEACGARAIVVTLDTTLLGWRPRDLMNAYLPFITGKGIAQYTSDPVFRSMLAKPPEEDRLGAAAKFVETYSNPGLSWDQLGFLRSRTKLPIILKGILHPEDARLAIEHGMDGAVVSNHGGRQVDGAIAALDALPAVVAEVGGKIPVLFDSGIRTGSDIFKALALGASAVLIGRPYVYGLAVGGANGVREVIRNLRADFDLTMGLSGCRSLAEITNAMLRQV